MVCRSLVKIPTVVVAAPVVEQGHGLGTEDSRIGRMAGASQETGACCTIPLKPRASPMERPCPFCHFDDERLVASDELMITIRDGYTL